MNLQFISTIMCGALPDPTPTPPPTVATARFESFLREPRERLTVARRRRLLLGASLAAHGALMAVGVIGAFWHVETLSGPAVAVTFLTAPPPPPPPPPPARKSAPKPRVKTPRPVVQPPVVQPPPSTPSEPEADDQDRSEDGDDQGSDGGGAGGIQGGIGSARPPGPTESERRALLERYLRDLFRTRIAARFRYPPEAERDGIEGLVVLRVSIDGTGRLLDVRLVGACTHPLLCDAASQTLLASAPFPPPPSQLGGPIAVDVPLAYRLQ
jgi:periplasmic protein TonB